jgi:hypothetical protein
VSVLIFFIVFVLMLVALGEWKALSYAVLYTLAPIATLFVFARLAGHLLSAPQRETARRLKLGLCPRCGHDLFNIPHGRCPECEGVE